MNFLKIKLLVVFATVYLQLKAQKNAVDYNVGWYQYFFQAKLNSRLFLYFDGAYRAFNMAEKTHLFSLRPGIGINITPTVSFIGGYCFFYANPFGGSDEFRGEHRPWQQVQFSSKEFFFNIQNRFRLEQRFFENKLTDSFDFNFRLRYQFNLQIPLKGKKVEKGVPYVILADEFFLNFGERIVYNHFDQNRVIVGPGYQISKKLAVNLQYIYTFIQRSEGNVFENQHMVRVAVLHNIDLTKPEPVAAP